MIPFYGSDTRLHHRRSILSTAHRACKDITTWQKSGYTQLAKKLNRNTKDILDELADMGFEGKSHSSSIDESIADKIARTLAAAEPAEAPSADKGRGCPRYLKFPKNLPAAPERTTELAAEAVAEVKPENQAGRKKRGTEKTSPAR